MKKVDELLLKSFVGPFVVSFGVALFVLIMQFLWLYIDEIAGKGVSIFIMMELIGYLSVSTFPMALPIAVLIASVMVMGNLAERYELSSIKSAGVSLLRILRPLAFVCSGIALFSYFTSDVLIPKANLKFRSRLFDIRKQKPALSIEEGTFNDDFRQFVIRVGEKEKDGETIGKVIIEDQTNVGRSKFNQILADSGQMFTTADKRFFVMRLYQGAQYQEPTSNGVAQSQKYPFIRTNFGSWTKVWDMQEFEMSRTDEERFKSQRSMLSVAELRKSVDSLYQLMGNTQQDVASDLLTNLKKNATPIPSPVEQAQQDSARRAGVTGIQQPPTANVTTFLELPPNTPIRKSVLDTATMSSILDCFEEKDRKTILDNALRQYQVSKSGFDNRKKQFENKRLEMVKTGYDLYSKYAFALICLVFLFIGGPMGALIRKGGFGYPILVSIIYFVVFIFLSIFCRKLTETYVLTPLLGALMPVLVLVPIAAFLTNRAVKDAQMFNVEPIERFFRSLAARFKKQQPV
ncbi:MAG: LptF/LptG family permease [Chitinophagales bacterium]